jgi:hypothetical protein
MQERGLLEADVDKSGLHAGQHPLNPGLVDVAEHPATAQPLDVNFGELAPFQDRDTGLLGRTVENDLLFHAVTLSAKVVACLFDRWLSRAAKYRGGAPRAQTSGGARRAARRQCLDFRATPR